MIFKEREKVEVRLSKMSVGDKFTFVDNPMHGNQVYLVIFGREKKILNMHTLVTGNLDEDALVMKIEEEDMSKRHIHAELMAQYAEDAKKTDEPWRLWEHKQPWCEWRGCKKTPIWNECIQYRRKPRTIRINGFDVPEPLRVGEVETGDTVWLADVVEGSARRVTFLEESRTNFGCLMNGLVHQTKKAADLHVKALVSFTEGV